MIIVLNMDTHEILQILRNDQAVKQVLLGVFPIDQVPPIFYKPAALIVNLDPSHEPGSHWVCMYFDKRGNCDYFDSYGMKPNSMLETYILENASKFKCSSKVVQKPLTSTCGQLCIYYLIWRARGVPMNMILDSLEKRYSDEFITGFVNNLFKVTLL